MNYDLWHLTTWTKITQPLSYMSMMLMTTHLFLIGQPMKPKLPKRTIGCYRNAFYRWKNLKNIFPTFVFAHFPPYLLFFVPYPSFLAWPQWWSFVDKGRVGVDLYSKISFRIMYFLFYLHWISSESSKWASF